MTTATKPRRKVNTKPKTAATKAAPKAPKAQKAAAPMYTVDPKLFTAASPPVRAHNRKLSPVVLNRTPENLSDRNREALKWMHAEFGTKPFERWNIDGGVIAGLAGMGLLKHVGGDLGDRTCTFQITGDGVKRAS